MTMQDIETRLRAAEDRLELMELEGAYAKAFDSRDGGAWAALFTENGIYQSRILANTPPGSVPLVEGRAALAKFCSEATFDGIHLLHLPQLTLDGDRATGRVHLHFLASFPAGERLGYFSSLVGYYDVAYERVDGRWLIRHRITTTFSRTRDEAFGYEPVGAFDAAASVEA
jgi:hypothetical protein